MVHLERTLVPLLTTHPSFWKRNMDHTINFIKIGTVDNILSMLNNFHPNIQFTYETEENFRSAFLDFMLCRDGENIVVLVYGKVTNADLYLIWNWLANSACIYDLLNYLIIGH